MTCAIYETDDGFVYVGRKIDDDTAPPPLMSTEAAKQWITDHPEICRSQDE